MLGPYTYWVYVMIVLGLRMSVESLGWLIFSDILKQPYLDFFFFQALFSCSSKFQKGHKTRQNVLNESSFTFFVFKLVRCIPSRELTYPTPRHFWRWFSFSQGGTCEFPGGYPHQQQNIGRTGVISPCLAGWKTWSCLDNSTVEMVKHWRFNTWICK